MHPWGVSGSSAMEHGSSACGTQTWTYYALDISLVGRRFSYLFCELLDVQLGQGPDLGTVPGHCLPPTPGTGLSPAEGHHGYPEAVGWKLSLEGPPLGCPQQCEWVRCLELRGRAGHVLSVCRILSDAASPRGQQAECCLLRVGVQTLTGAALSLSPRGPPWQQALSSCWVPGKGPQPLQLQGTGEGRAGRGSCVYQNYSPCLSSLTRAGEEWAPR